MTTPDPGSGPGQATDEAILLALDRVNASLRIVLAAIAELKAEMASRPPTHRDQDAIPPYDAWVGTPQSARHGS